MLTERKLVYIETYGCQMNVADSEIVLSLLADAGYEQTPRMENADLVLVNTCSVRENAEQRIYGRLGEFKHLKNRKPGVVVGLLGCMAERLRTKLSHQEARGVGQIIDLIVGPDEYRKMPELVHKAWHGERGIAVQLSRVETYDDIVPLRTEGISAWISVMRGCDKFCTFCVVPFTRGRERSRSFQSILAEVEALSHRGFKEVTLLGQNVNSYLDGNLDFADLLSGVAAVDRTMRVRFTTSHPQDMSDKLIDAIAVNSNICKYVHLPFQSGSDRVLDLMNRTYTSGQYKSLIERVRRAMPDVALSTDIIAGFPTETEDDHRRTMELLEEVRFDGAFTFKYSPRENTPAFKMEDDVPDAVKARRINEMLEVQQRISLEKNLELVGRTETILIDGPSRKSDQEWQGRTDGNKTTVFTRGTGQIGQYADVVIDRANSATLFGRLLGETTTHIDAILTEGISL